MDNVYTRAENATWNTLISNRRKSLSHQACGLYLEGLENLKLPLSHVPTPGEMNELIKPFSTWRMVPTTKLVLARNYFKMLSSCQFPVITSMRPSEEMAYYTSPKPDVIHEYFGHGPFLTNVNFSNFMQDLAQVAMKHERHEQILLARLFWFTIEFGLISTAEGLRAYGAGIIPSEAESLHALYSEQAERRDFNIVDILRTPFSAIGKQKIYYVIPNFDILFSLPYMNFSEAIQQANKRGNFA